MSDEILVNVTPQETRLALVENGVLKEIHIERNSCQGLVGNIYKARVQRVLPGMQAAFVEMGLERTAFLHARDMQRGDGEGDCPEIRELIQDGDEMLVQVTKDPLGTKGARLSTQISIPSRRMVLLPATGNVGVSARIEDEQERLRLKETVQNCREAQSLHYGFIVRTAGEGAGAEALGADMAFLARLWESISRNALQAGAGSLVHGDLPLVMRLLRDYMGPKVHCVKIDSQRNFHRVKAFAQRFMPEAAERIRLYTGARPLFDLYNVEDELDRALERKVMLKSGGYLIFDQTEAMTTVDVNTGGFVGYRNLEETFFKTNLEAVQAVARQLRLRNLGGIVIIDFIDMEEPEHRYQVLQALEKSLTGDPVRCTVGEISPLGLVEMTRKRTRESLERMLCEPCAVCAGRGTVKTVETVCIEILREVARTARQFEAREFLVLACADVIDALLDEYSPGMAELEAGIERPIKLQAESLYHQEQFDVVLI
jgi:ribonuclease G